MYSFVIFSKFCLLYLVEIDAEIFVIVDGKTKIKVASISTLVNIQKLLIFRITRISGILYKFF